MAQWLYSRYCGNHPGLLGCGYDDSWWAFSWHGCFGLRYKIDGCQTLPLLPLLDMLLDYGSVAKLGISYIALTSVGDLSLMFLLTSVAENVWNKVPCKGLSPPALCGHAACVLDNKMYIHGGFADRVSVRVYTLYDCCFKCRPQSHCRKICGDGLLVMLLVVYCGLTLTLLCHNVTVTVAAIMIVTITIVM